MFSLLVIDFRYFEGEILAYFGNFFVDLIIFLKLVCL